MVVIISVIAIASIIILNYLKGFFAFFMALLIFQYSILEIIYVVKAHSEASLLWPLPYSPFMV
jgi:hypothetical protein